MDADELVRAIRAALDETERIATWAAEEVGDGHWQQRNVRIVTVRDRDREVADFVAGVELIDHIVHHDPAAVLRRVAADRELVNMAENAFLSAGVFRDIDERWGAVEMQYLHVMRTLARGLGITPEEETP